MRSKLIYSVVLTFAAFSLLIAAPASHAETFTFSASGTYSPYGSSIPFEASGTLEAMADPTDPGAYEVLSGTGEVNGVDMTLVPYVPNGNGYDEVSGPDYSFEYDDLLLPSGSPVLDEYGLLFSSGSDYENFFYAGGSYDFSNEELQTALNGDPITFTLSGSTSSVTPEPSSLLLLATGLLGVGGLVRRRLV